MSTQPNYSADKSYYALLDIIHEDMLEARNVGLPADAVSVLVEGIVVMIKACIPPEEQELYAKETADLIEALVKKFPVSDDYGSTLLEMARSLDTASHP